MAKARPEPAPPRRQPIHDVVTDVICGLEHAIHGPRRRAYVVAPLHGLLGLVHEGVVVLSRGPWPLQRGLLLTVVADQPRLAEASPSTAPLPLVLGLSVEAARDLVMRAAVARVGMSVDDFREGRVAHAQWAGLAEAMAALAELPITFVDAPADGVSIDVDGGRVRWLMLPGDSPVDFIADVVVDVVVDVTMQDDGLQLVAIDGRCEPPMKRSGRFRGNDVTLDDDTAAACARAAYDDVRQGELVAEFEKAHEEHDEDDNDEQPADDDEQPADDDPYSRG